CWLPSAPGSFTSRCDHGYRRFRWPWSRCCSAGWLLIRPGAMLPPANLLPLWRLPGTVARSFAMSRMDLGSAINPQLFWASFQQEAEELWATVFRREVPAAHQRIQELLVAANYPYVHELTSEGTDAVLVLTPEGDRSVARTVDWFVS